MNYDAQLYSKSCNFNSESVQLRRKFLKQFVPVMNWSDGNDILMDVGCGPGDAIFNILFPCIPEVKSVIAIDVLPYMIENAKLHNAHPKIQYHLADVTKIETLKTWIGKISKISSTYCLQSLQDQEEAFNNMFHLLCENGEAIIYFTLNSSFYSCYDGIISSPKWQKFLEGVYIDIPDSHKMNYKSGHYKNILESMGYEVLFCEDEHLKYSYKDDIAAKESIASFCSITFHIPEDLKEDFKSDLFQSYMKHNSRDADGRPETEYCMLSLHLRKPRSNSI